LRAFLCPSEHLSHCATPVFPVQLTSRRTPWTSAVRGSAGGIFPVRRLWRPQDGPDQAADDVRRPPEGGGRHGVCHEREHGTTASRGGRCSNPTALPACMLIAPRRSSALAGQSECLLPSLVRMEMGLLCGAALSCVRYPRRDSRTARLEPHCWPHLSSRCRDLPSCPLCDPSSTLTGRRAPHHAPHRSASRRDGQQGAARRLRVAWPALPGAPPVRSSLGAHPVTGMGASRNAVSIEASHSTRSMTIGCVVPGSTASWACGTPPLSSSPLPPCSRPSSSTA
jgi:hypothetical protein